MMTNNRNQPLTPGTFLKTTTIIYLALTVGQVLFGIVASTQAHISGFSIKYTGDPLLFVVPLMAVGSFIASNFMFKQQLGMAISKATLPEKLGGYQTALLIRFALLEGASLFGIVVFLTSGNLFFIAISGLLVLYFLTIRPTKDKTQTDLNLSYEETSELAN